MADQQPFDIACSDIDNGISLWNATGNYISFKSRHRGISKLAVWRTYLLSAGDDNIVRFYYPATQLLLREFQTSHGVRCFIRNMAIDEAHNLLYTYATDNAIHTYDLSQFPFITLAGTLAGALSVTGFAVDTDKKLVFAGSDSAIFYWHPSGEKLQKPDSFSTPGAIRCLAVASSKSLLISGGTQVNSWNYDENGRLPTHIHTLCHNNSTQKPCTAQTVDVCILPQSDQVVACCTRSHLTLWNLNSSTSTTQIIVAEKSIKGDFTCLLADPLSNMVYAGRGDGKIYCFNATNLERKRVIDGTGQAIFSLTHLPVSTST